ncbi:MAG: ABC transporter ATP-binding protein [Clostridium sp.]|jgi:lipopolysaccharide transport system ATP-binding protein|nr:ABC transporter ATP-binding protein [Clostridium sp.]
MKEAIFVDNISVRFNKANVQITSLKEYFIRSVKSQLMFQEFFALRDVSLHVKTGESWGIIGRNGSGKSTLLKVICGILAPYKGVVRANGSIAPIIELGAGFEGELSARENIFLHGAILGHSKRTMQEYYDEIVDFAELSDFLDTPLKNYSSGMNARLGFAIATAIQPDILIIDEVLSVGDYAFKAKCEKRMQQMIGRGTTLLFVSHDSESVTKLCQNAIWLEKGECVKSGSAAEVSAAYLAEATQDT